MAKDKGDNMKDLSGFEESLTALEQQIKQLELGELSLQDSLIAFERGTTLVRQAQQALAAAEQKILQLSANDDGTQLEQFKSASEDEG